jgi:AraC-like DNA-binding protein
MEAQASSAALNQAVNPPAAELGRRNAVLWGRGARRYHVRDFPGPLSIKSLVRGSAEWRVPGARFEVDSGSYLILNDGQPYSITVESQTPVETFCVFFQRGFVEDAWRSRTRSEEELLDDPDRAVPVGFYERLRPREERMAFLLDRLYRRVSGREGSADLDEGFRQLALALVALRAELPREMARIPAVKSSTRAELFKRVHAGKRIMDDALEHPLRLAGIARQACLSPFHFHRLFRAVFGETPHAYLSRRRLERASRLLRETDSPVTGICLDSGFQSLGTFSTVFQARFGVSPREFRRSQIRKI